MKLTVAHVTCPNCNLALEHPVKECSRCGAAIDWGTLLKKAQDAAKEEPVKAVPEAPKPAPPKVEKKR